MIRFYGFLTVVLLSVGMVVAGCTQAAPAPTAAPAKASEPTKAPAAPTKAAEATKPAVPAAPTAAPAPKISFPEKGRAITWIVPYAAGGLSDLSVRVLAPFLEKELGVPIQVVNRAGAATQVGTTELANAKPDGYTIGTYDIPTGNINYLLPERKATYNKKSFQPLTTVVPAQAAWAVKADSPFKGVKDLIDAAKVNPGTIKNGGSGIITGYGLGSLTVMEATGIKLNVVQFEGSGPVVTALLGGHVDIATIGLTSGLAAYKAGDLRFLGVMGSERDPIFPNVPTFDEQGFKVPVPGTYFTAVAPAGLPKEITDTLSGAIRKVMADPAVQQKGKEASFSLAPMTPAQVDTLWDEVDVWLKAILPKAVAYAEQQTK